MPNPRGDWERGRSPYNNNCISEACLSCHATWGPAETVSQVKSVEEQPVPTVPRKRGAELLGTPCSAAAAVRWGSS